MIAVEKDYILRLIRAAIQGIAAICFKTEKEERKRDLQCLLDRIDEGDINGAENFLFECPDLSLCDALQFYGYCNEKDDAFLQSHGFSREEIVSGLKDITEKFGMGDVSDIFFSQLGDE